MPEGNDNTDNRNNEPADALKALAEGTAPLESSDIDEPTTTPDTEESGPQIDPPVDFDITPSTQGATTDRITRSSNWQKAARQAQAHQYKKTMIPLLVTLSLVLMVCALVVVYRIANQPAYLQDDLYPQQMRTNPTDGWRWFPYVAFPMAIALLGGAWFFHREVRACKPADAKAGNE